MSMPMSEERLEILRGYARLDPEQWADLYPDLVGLLGIIDARDAEIRDLRLSVTILRAALLAAKKEGS